MLSACHKFSQFEPPQKMNPTCACALRFPKYGCTYKPMGCVKAQTLTINVISIIIKTFFQYMAKMLQSYKPLITVRVLIGDLIILSSSLEWTWKPKAH